MQESSTPFKPGFHYGNKKNLVSKEIGSFRKKEELLSTQKTQTPSIFAVFKNLFCCHQEKNNRNSPKTMVKPSKRQIMIEESDVKRSQTSINLNSNPNQKSIDATLFEGLTQTSTAGSNQMNNETSSNKINLDTSQVKDNTSKITKSMLLENDLFGLPIESLFILRKDVGICNLLGKIKFVDFFLNENSKNLSKKSLSNPCSNQTMKQYFNLATLEKDFDFSSFKKESLGRKSMNFKENKHKNTNKDLSDNNANNNWTESLKSKKNEQQILLNFYEKNMILDFDQWRNVSPEQCAKHTAKRIKNKGVILDAFCGIGGNLIYFAKENQVVGIDINQKTLNFAKHNAFNHRVFENVQLIQGDFIQMSFEKFSPDVIFINPEIVENCNKEKFSIFTDLTPDIGATVLKSYNISRNLILSLPKLAKITEIASLFSTILKRTDKKIDDITIEIEYFFINGELEQIQVYSGDIKQITVTEELDFLYNYLCKGAPLEKSFTYQDIRHFLRFLLRKLKLPKICFYLLKIEEINNCEHSIFQKFLNILKMYQEIVCEDLDKFFFVKKMEDCAEKHLKNAKNEENLTNFKNSLEDMILSPSYYSGNLFTLTEDKKKKFSFEGSLNNELWMDSINY